MRILLTGATSQQANSAAHQWSANFMGLLRDQLRLDETNHVDWLEPSVHWTREKLLGDYDHIFVGLASPLAVGANRIYGALSVLEQLAGSCRVTIVLDAPDPDLIVRGLRSVSVNWGAFTKEFFSYRREYDLARNPETNARLRGEVERLLTAPWGKVLVPAFPWNTQETVAKKLPLETRGKVSVLNLDHLLLERYRPSGGPRERSWRLAEWSYEKSSDQKWLDSQNLRHPLRELKGNHRIQTDPLHATQLGESLGLLVGPHRGETWWTPKVAMALAQGTPVFTDWYQSAPLGPAWQTLPATHEVTTASEGDELARKQYVSYAAAIPQPSEAKNALYKAAGVKTSKARSQA